MAKIHLLDSETIDKIAAGEVVERPASVVKELVENAIDALATSITVEIKEGGIEFIRITDNGCGMERDQIRNAFLRHATSKISDAQDLMCISSLGFRGEALSSIAAVSKVELISKTVDTLTGTRIYLEGGKEISFEEVGAPEGTTFIVKNLFYNTPVRRKFLKTAATETSYISELMEHLALSRPDISFQLIVGNQTKFYTSGNGDLKEVIYRIYGKEMASNLLPIQVENEGIRVEGYLGKPLLVRANRNFEIYFLNGRYVQSTLLSKAIEEGYKEYLMQHKFPVCFLHISMEASSVDVNVHPTKMDVRFSDHFKVSEIMSGCIRSTLAVAEMIPKVSLEEEKETQQNFSHAPEPFELQRKDVFRMMEDTGYSTEKMEKQNFIKSPVWNRVLQKEDQPQASHLPGTEVSAVEEDGFFTETLEGKEETKSVNTTEAQKIILQESSLTTPVEVTQLELFEEKILTQTARMKYRFIGQLFDTYWLIQFGNEFLIMDQHAAHEKILFERMMKKLKNKQEIFTQSMNPPAIITLSAVEEDILNRHINEFKRSGYEIEPFGGKEYALYGVPANLPRINGEAFFRELIDRLGESGVSDSTLILETIASMSCKAAVKGNHMMSLPEAEKLVDELMTLENPYACPHGRPTIIRMSKAELEKKFSRIV